MPRESIYGTTGYGGAYNKGTVYKLSHQKHGWYETRLVTFGSSKNAPATPEGALTFDSDGNLYGATIYGGPANVGTIFKLAQQLVFQGIRSVALLRRQWGQPGRGRRGG